MQYHARALASNGVEVDLVGLEGTPLSKRITDDPRITIHRIKNTRLRIRRSLYGSSYAVAGLFDAVRLGLRLRRTLRRLPRPDLVLVQNPPAFPTFAVTWWSLRRRGVRFFIDWHNLGYTLLRLRLGHWHPAIRLARWLERRDARRVEANICVSRGLAAFLESRFGVTNAHVLYDRPASAFTPIDRVEREQIRQALFVRLGIHSGTIGFIGRALTTDATRPAFRTWVAALLKPALQHLGWTPRQGEPDDAATARATLVGTLGAVSRDAEVLSKARELALAELEKPGSVQPGLVNVVVDLAASDGDQALYEKYLERSRAAKDPEEKYRYLNALTSFRDPALVRRTMNLILGPDVRSQDAKVLIAQLLGNTDTQHLGWELLQARWDDVQKKTGEFVGNTVIVSGLGAFCDARTVDEVKQFFSAHTVPDAERTLQQTIERIASCAALSAAQSDKLAAWLMTR